MMQERRRADQQQRIARVLTWMLLLCGLSVVAVAIAVEWIPGSNAGFGTAQKLLVAIGAVYIGAGVALRWLPFVFAKLSLSLVVLFALVVVIEGTCRLVGFDFNSSQRAWNAMPIYYRQATVPVGEIYFRREGPVQWQGQVIRSWLAQSGVKTDAYADEPAITVKYDKLGFRNPADLDDWEVVVVGDSFTELGHVAYDDLFSTKAGQVLGVQTRNLGVSATGPLTHNFYLREYGAAASTTDAVLAFFEGNDIQDLLWEHELLEEWKTTGQRPVRDLASSRQTSFLVFIGQVGLRGPRISDRMQPNARFVHGDSSADVTLFYTPQNRAELDSKTKTLFEAAITEWADIARQHKMRPWLLYLPAKRRVLDGFLKFDDNTPSRFVDWQPSDLPDYVRDVCNQAQMQFTDATPVLVEEAQKGRLPFNPAYDSHLNTRGSQIVGQVIADALSKERAADNVD